MQASFLIAAVLTALIGFCHGQTEVPSCPTTMMDFSPWMAAVIKKCNEAFVIALRESKENCAETMSELEPCLTAEQDKCLADLDDDDTLKSMIEGALGGIIAGAPGYAMMFCSTGPTQDINPTTMIDGCDNGMEAASLECHAPFMAIFNEDKVDVRLCEAFKTMVSCETDKVKELCPNADDMEVAMDDQTRAMGNFYCVDAATPTTDKPATTAAAAGDGGDDVGSAQSVVVSLITIVSATYLSIFVAL